MLTRQETHIPIIAPTGALLPSEIYENQETSSLYQKVIAEVFENVLPTNELKAKAGELARGIVQLERQLASNTPTSNGGTVSVPRLHIKY